MKIKRYQTGGIVYTPFFRDSVAPQQTSQSTKSGGDGDEIQKAIISVIEENGLPNDVDYFLKQANAILASSNGLFSWSGNVPGSYDMSDLIKLHSLANKIRHNSETHKKAAEQVISEGSGSEVAITNTGGLYVQDKDGKLKTISINSYYENSDKYQLLTNADLMNLREYAPDLAYNSNILNDLKNTVGIKTIVDHMKSTIGAFGTDKTSDSTERYTAKQKGAIEKGFEAILGGAAPEGIYSVKSKTTVSDQGYSDNESLLAATQYLWSTLDQRMKNTLRAHTVAEGLNPNDPKDVYRILISAIQEHTSHSRERDIDISYDASASKAGGSGSSKTESLAPKSYLEMVSTGAVTNPVLLDLRESTGKADLQFYAQPYPLLDHSNKIVTSQSLTGVINNAQIGQVIDRNSITFGNKRLSDAELDLVLYDGTSQLHKAWLPVDQNAAMTGVIKPDLDALSKYEDFMEWFNSGQHSQQMVAHKMREMGLNLVYDPENHTFKFNNAKSFFVLTGATSRRAVDISDSLKGNVTYDEGNKYYNILEEETPYNEGVLRGWWGDASSVYKSAIFMPILDASMATVGTNAEYVPKSYYVDIYNRRNYNETQDEIISNFTL